MTSYRSFPKNDGVDKEENNEDEEMREYDD
jgi:hypothetical protein